MATGRMSITRSVEGMRDRGGGKLEKGRADRAVKLICTGHCRVIVGINTLVHIERIRSKQFARGY